MKYLASIAEEDGVLRVTIHERGTGEPRVVALLACVLSAPAIDGAIRELARLALDVQRRLH